MKIVSSPLMERLGAAKEIFWLNPKLNESESSLVNQAGVEDARKRLERFAAYFVKAFPETAATGGLIESQLIPLPNLTNSLQLASPVPLTGRFFLKGDHDLPISGSIKARGGIYEILVLAEKIALESGMLKPDQDYSILTEPQFHQLFSHYAVAVGSTGNLGLSIGIMSAKLGFQVTVHMSADARQWKKDLLRSKGAIVVEYDGDFMLAVQQGRKQAALDPACHFVDDENSTTLFYGYSVAGKRTAEQLHAAGVSVDAEHPLFVYLPCGVGGSPGGITYGLKQQYGSHVHCIFAESVQSPCMLLGVATGLHDEICVQDVGLSGKTALDGLAVGRPSKLIGRIVGHRLDAIYTLEDAKAYAMLTRLYDTEGIALEPSACVGLFGYQLTQSDAAYRKRFTEQQWSNATHIAWATGGSMVPEAEMAAYIEKGRLL